MVLHVGWIKGMILYIDHQECQCYACFGLYLVGALSAEVPFVILHQNNGCLHFNTFCVICDILYIENSILCHFCHNLHSDLASPCHIQYAL